MANSTVSRSRRIYFDNAAAVMPDPRALAEQYTCASRFYANQEAGHSLAYSLRQQLEQAEDKISQALCGEETFVHWGESGTDVLRLLSGFEAFQSGNIVTAPFEHSALQAALNRCGAEVRLARLERGRVDLQHLQSLLDNNTVLCSIIHVQNETGVIQDLPAIRKIISKQAPQCLFMSDTIQSSGKIPLPWREAGLDIICASGHKTGAAAGAALLFRKNKETLKALNSYLCRCRKEYFTSGRPQVPAAMALTGSILRSCRKFAENRERVLKINSFLRAELSKLKLRQGKNILFTASPETASPYILHFIVPGYQGAILVRMLSRHNIFFSSGSACQAEDDSPSKTLTAMGFSSADAYAGIRLSFSPQNTLQEAEIFIKEFLNALEDY